MVSFIKKTILLCLVFSMLLLNGCTLTNTKNQSTNTTNEMPDVKPKDFKFVFNYGVGAKNQLDTSKGQYTKDMIIEPSIAANLSLSDEEMNIIYLKMRKMNIFSYPNKFTPKSDKCVTPFQTYSIKIIINGKEKNIYWEDENLSEIKEATQLRELFEVIDEIIVNKEEYKKLPKPKGGYD